MSLRGRLLNTFTTVPVYTYLVENRRLSLENGYLPLEINVYCVELYAYDFKKKTSFICLQNGFLLTGNNPPP